MSSVLQKPKLLIVDTSPSMAKVLSTYAEQKNYRTEVYSDPAEACRALDQSSARLSDDGYQCVVLGWPEGKISIVADLLAKLSDSVHSDLPLVLVSQQDCAVIETLSKRRSKTRTLLWKNFRDLSELTDKLVFAESKSLQSNAPAATPHVLLIDNNPTDCAELTEQLKRRNYQVSMCSSIVHAKSALQTLRIDLVVSDYNLHGESARQLSDYIRSMESRPVYAFMALDNLDESVQSSLALGAITCLDKNEPADGLAVRLSAMVNGLPSRTIKTVKPQTLVPLESFLEMADEPALILDAAQRIVAVNHQAVEILATGERHRLINKNFGNTISDNHIQLAPNHPVDGEFSSLSGVKNRVAYRLKKLNAASLGIECDHYLLQFKVLEEIPAVTQPVKRPATPAVVVASAPVEPIKEYRVLDKQAMQQVLDQTVMDRKAGQVISLLMLDIKMLASSSGDRLSLGSSEPLLGIVKENIARQYPRENSLAYVGEGRFVLLIETNRVEQALNLSKKIVRAVPQLLANLEDIQLLSHAAFLRVPEHATMNAALLLKHCTAACLKTELAGRDNEAYVIGKELWQTENVRADVTAVSHDVKTRVLPTAPVLQEELSGQ